MDVPGLILLTLGLIAILLSIRLSKGVFAVPVQGLGYLAMTFLASFMVDLEPLISLL